ncbi:S9 family peptidase [candidate division KSB1 bacterium]|nr:S9 family peptidase [candidate division KSB1 bacterium]NIR71788.1 S9 family peptidase [candidate division KSB1 bacterium]NIS25770.1 S9 family peptidase [candidate division KSB1 bacterium]NIT72639.1 S9 family peptidase [candidate division KSB1 bacterium]NIU26460.1 S9 family peptidase [candidate division KSB1 bacterium]
MKRARAQRIICLLFVLIVTSFLYGQVERIEKGNLVIEGIPEIPAHIQERMLQYQNIRSASLQDWHPGGEGMLISTRFGETRQIHWVKTPLGARQQITFFAEPVGGANMRPVADDPGFLFSKDVGGSEFYQLFYFDMETGIYQMLTDGKSRNGFGLWSNHGDRFSYYSTKRNGRDWDVFVADLAQPEQAQAALEKTGTWVAVDWSPDDSRLIVFNYVSINESYPYILDLETKELTQINPSEEKIAYGGVMWAKDGKGIYLTSDENSEFQRLQYYNLETQQTEVLTEDISWDVNSFDLSDDGKFLAFVTNEGGISKLHLWDLESETEQGLPDIPVGQIYGLEFHPDNSRLGMVLNTPQTPGDVFVLDIANRKLTRWTKSEVGGLNTDNFVVPELIHYETFDEVDGEPRMIPAFYYRPNNTSGQPLPVLISIHGGPEGQYRPFFSWSFQYYLNELGIAVLAPNVRGSAGYGKSYVKLDNAYKREDSVKDIGKLLDWIEKQPDLDANRVAVIGGSYGGYMVLSSMFHYNDRLRCGVDIVGISNFVTFLENTKDYRRDLRRVEYGDERDPKMHEFLNEISPTTNAHKITKPMLIAQGLNDPRVPASESEQMVEVIRENGGTVWYLLAKDEGHGFRKKSNRDYYYNAVALFLETFLLGERTSMR